MRALGALAVLSLLAVRCDSGDSPVGPSPTPTPARGCAQLDGTYAKSVADSTCIGPRQLAGPIVRKVADCRFEAYDVVVGGTVTLETAGNEGVLTVVWPACEGRAVGKLTFEDGSVSATFSGDVHGSDPSCCGPTAGSFRWTGRR